MSEQASRDRQNAVDTVEQIRRVTKVKCQTCPHWYAARDESCRAGRLWNWREKNALASVECDLTSRMVEALDVIDEAIADRNKFLEKKLKEKR